MSSISKKTDNLRLYLDNSGIKINSNEYRAICIRGFLINLLAFILIFYMIFLFLQIATAHIYSIGTGFLISIFVYFIRINYPRVYSRRRTREIEKKLMPVMQDILVQLNSGVSIFNIIINISKSNYGAASDEFKKIAAEINSGVPQIVALDNAGRRNSTSVYFKRILWQISNGMKAGSDMSIVIRESIKTLSKEQALQIEEYGSKLNPLAMFFMLIAVILPALFLTFLIIVASMLNLSENSLMLIMGGLFVGVVFVQIMFLGIIKSKRPKLI